MKRKSKTPAAVRAFRNAAHRYPAKSWYQDIASAVGEDPADLEFWREIVKEWVGLGWKPTNVKGMLECYRRRKRPGDGTFGSARSRGSGSAQRVRRAAPVNPIEAAERLIEQEGWT
jgi:hypothetical protein